MSNAPGTRAFKRIARVTIWRNSVAKNPTKFSSSHLNVGDALIITDLRIRFKITKGLTKAPNQCDLYLYNLSADSRAEMESLPLSVQLEAGYDNNPAVLFVGDVHYAQSEQKDADWETLLQIGDGDRQYVNARVNASFKKGSTIRQVLTSAATSIGYALPASLLSDPSLDRPFVTGTAVRGPARDVISQMLSPLGYRWSIQNGKLTVLKDDGTLNTATSSPASAVPIDQNHLMIGTPTFGSPPKSGHAPHINCRTLLNPEINAGQLVKLTSLTKNGLFRVESVEIEGDTHGSGETSWTSMYELKPF